MTARAGARKATHLGHRARWTATLVVAPCAAAMFGAAASWAGQTEPPKSATTISHAKATAARAALRLPDEAADARTASLRRESAHGRQAAAAMRRDLVALQVQLARLQGKAAGPGPSALPTAADRHHTTRPLAVRTR